LDVLQRGHADGAILSPKHLKTNKLIRRYAELYGDLTEWLMVDPQCYDPKPAHPDSFPMSRYACDPQRQPDETSLQSSVRDILQWESGFGVTAYIVPATCSATASKHWLYGLRVVADEAVRWAKDRGDHRPVLATLPLSDAALTLSNERAKVLDHAVSLEVDGFYVVLDGALIPCQSEWLTGMMDLVFRLRQHGFAVILGYASYSAVLAFPVGLTAFASGGFNKQRSFLYKTWSSSGGSHPRTGQKYWTRRLLGRIGFSAEAEQIHRADLWDTLADQSPYAIRLFGQSSPAEVDKLDNWKDTQNFAHYFWTCYDLAARFKEVPVLERAALTRRWLRDAMTLWKQLNDDPRIQLKERGEHLSIWESSFDAYIASIGDQLHELEWA